MPFEPYVPTPSAEEGQAYASLMYEAYATDVLSPLMYPVPAPPKLISDLAAYYTSSWGKDPNQHILSVRDTETNDPAAFVMWHDCAERSGEEWKKFPDPPLPEGWDKEFVRGVAVKSWAARVRVMGTQPYICASRVVVLPLLLRLFRSSLLT